MSVGCAGRTHLIIAMTAPRMRRVKRDSCHGLSTSENGGGLLGGRRARMNIHEGARSTAFIPVMVRRAFRNPGFKRGSARHGRTHDSNELFEGDREEHSAQTRPARDDPHDRTPPLREPVTCHSCHGRPKHRAGHPEGHVGEDELVVFRADCVSATLHSTTDATHTPTKSSMRG